MVRFFFILVGLALVVWVGQRYFMDHPSGSGFWDKFGSHMDSDSTPAPGGTPIPIKVGYNIKGCRAALQELAKRELVPLDESTDFSTSEAVRVLQETQSTLGDNRSDADYASLVQACNALGQALQDRQACMARYQRATAIPTPAPPGNSGLKTGGLKPAASGTQTSNSFFKEAALKDWRARCDYYQPLVERLLTPSS